MYNKTYCYSKMFPTSLICLIILLPSIALLVMKTQIGIGTNSEESTMLLVMCSPILVMIIAPLVWLINILMTRIQIYEDRLEIINIFKKLIVRWNDIIELNKKSFFSGTFPMYGPPRDLEVITRSNKKIKIYYFIESNNGDKDGIEDLELEIRKHLIGEN